MRKPIFQFPFKKTGILIAGVVLVFTATSVPLYAKAQINAPEGIPPISEQRPEGGGYAEAEEYGPQSFINILGQIRDFLLIAAIVFVVIMIIISGVNYIQGKGGADQEKIKRAKDQLLWTLIGTGAILAAYVLISTLRNIISSQSLV